MSRLHDVYQRLRLITDVTVDRAFAAALPTADPSAVRLIALSLLERQQHVEGKAALIQFYDRLPPEVQTQVIRFAHRWDHALRSVAEQKLAQGPSNAVRIIVAARAAHLTYLVTSQLHNRPPDLRRQAAAGLLELARWIRSDQGPGPGHAVRSNPNTSSARHVQDAIQEAVRFYHTHQQASVLLALAVLGPCVDLSVFRRTRGGSGEAAAEMGRMLVHADEPEIRSAMLVMVQAPSLVSRVLQGLSIVAGDDRLSDVLRCWHLLLSQRVVKALGRLAQPQWLCPAARDLAHWPADATRGLARWVVALPLSRPQCVEKLSQLTALSDAFSRLAALRQLVLLSDDGKTGDMFVCQAISRFCVDGEMAVAWIALRYLVGRRWQGLPGLLPRLINSPHPRVAQLARQKLAPLGFDRLWRGWAHMSLDKKLALGRALIKMEGAFRNQLRGKLTSSSPSDQLRAMSMVHVLHQGDWFEPVLLRLMGHSDQKRASAAARALGTAQSPRAVEALEAGLSHRDSRVRANAVEALAQLKSVRHVKTLFRMAQDEDGRPRANAIRALMEMNVGDALSALTTMLHDTQPTQRASALWVVETMGLLRVARDVAEMSISDPDGHVQNSADRVIRGLIGLMNATPARRPESGEPAPKGSVAQ